MPLERIEIVQRGAYMAESLEGRFLDSPYGRSMGGAPAAAGARGWEGIFRVGGFAAGVLSVLIPVQVAVFILWPPPGSVLGWFALFRAVPFVGLLDLDLLLIVDQVLMGIIFLALFLALRSSARSSMTIALLFAAMGIAAYFASTAAFEMLSLSARHAASADAGQRSTLEAAGDVVLATWQGTAFNLGYLLEGGALLIVAIVMARSPLFGRAAGPVGIVLGGLSLVPPTVPVVGMAFSLGSLVPLELWSILISLRLFRLGASSSRTR